ncbi:fatty acid--CoA ligase family protein [Bacillus sp. CGMCC 1.16541]|uniref:fatty acid--CoA ligase family protein n=1 Tax=Bacillus sp. CGMCC 1.16541 TaxID=2185143 RepID=UPI000D730447|nr:fatty acid--CoA ligase family protein [Bacillus sp. CGMCC 1.16541]
MNLSTQLHETAVVNPTKAAYMFAENHVTYGELDASISKFASGLQKLGVQKGDHVALLLGNSPHFVIGLYGALRMGATVIPINPIYTADEITYILKNGDVKAVIALDLLLPLLANVTNHLPALEHVILCETPQGKELLSNQDSTIPSFARMFSSILELGHHNFNFPELVDEDVAIILYTSGTTGKPKGAMLTHKNVYRNAKDVADFLDITEKDRVVATLPMFHVFCLTVALNAPLMNGGTILIVPKFSPGEVFRVVREHNATIFAGVPTMYNFLMQHPQGTKEDVQTLRLCISGGASMPVALLKGFEQKFDVIISEGYGLSEASPVTCFNPLDKERKVGSIGTSIMNVENKIVDEMGEEVPVGQVGELIVKGPNVMKGYYKMPEETTYTIKDGWLYTGDLGRVDEEGYFYIVDRKKDMIIVGGYNVYPREVEEVLYNHEAVTEVAVIGVPDMNFGEAVKCFVVVRDSTVTEEDLLQHCREQLAKYKVPTEIEFLEELPKNTTGKILRRALKQQLLEQS